MYLKSFELAHKDDVVLTHAADPFPTTLASLDAIHVATAILIKAHYDELLFATHDAELAQAARAMGFRVLGSGPR